MTACVCVCMWVCMCVRVTWRDMSLNLLINPFLCLPLGTRGNHIVTTYFRVPTQPLPMHFSASLALFQPSLLLFIFTPLYLAVFLYNLFSFAGCLPLSIFLHFHSSLSLTFPPPLSQSLPLSAQSSAAQLAWFSSGVVKYKYNKDVFELVNPFWAAKHHHRAHRCGTHSGERERDGWREGGERIPHLKWREYSRSTALLLALAGYWTCY